MAARVFPKRSGWNAAWERERWYRVPGKGWVKCSQAEAEQRYIKKFVQERKEGPAWTR